MKLTLIRHGPTEWNALRRFQGRTDTPLSVRGRATARAIAETLHAERFDRIYSSDLKRAAQTARILGESRGAEVAVDQRLREFDFGRWEGLTWDEIIAANPHLAGLGSSAANLYAPEGGESFAQVSARVASFLDDLTQQNLRAAAVVTHAGVLHAVFSVLGLAPPERFTAGGITRIAIEAGGASLLALDDRKHLDDAS
ncbi:MAG: histidine phosphatase family protein [Candidatus Cybelea sp.]